MNPKQVRYLLVTHISFARNEKGHVVLDSLWAEDIKGLAEEMETSIRIAAPEISYSSQVATWGPTQEVFQHPIVEFVGFPPIKNRKDIWRWQKIRKGLRREIMKADLVHTSNFFSPYLGLFYAHRFASKLGKKTLFVISEDFYDIYYWKCIRTASSMPQRWYHRYLLEKMERKVRQAVATASLTFLHTPPVVFRYRLLAKNGIAIRQPVHNAEDVINEEVFHKKCEQIQSGSPLIVVSICRHVPLKGLDLLIRSVAELKRRGIKIVVKIYGKGEMTPQLEQLSQRLKVSGLISFLGPIFPGKQLYNAFADVHVCVMPHRTHDFGRAFYDAMAGGTPVVAFHTTASTDTVRDRIDGLLVPLDNVLALADAIEQLHYDRAFLVRLSQSARKRALLETKKTWFRYRAERIKELF